MAESNVATQSGRAESNTQRVPAPCALVIFGASGDLTERKLVPALYYLSRAGLLPDGFSMIGCAKTPYTDESFRDKMQKAVKKFLDLPDADHEAIRSFTKDVHYISDDFGDAKAYDQLKKLLDQLDQQRG